MSVHKCLYPQERKSTFLVGRYLDTLSFQAQRPRDASINGIDPLIMPFQEAFSLGGRGDATEDVKFAGNTRQVPEWQTAFKKWFGI